jgi:integrase
MSKKCKPLRGSVKFQLSQALNSLKMSPAEIQAYKIEHNVDSVKKDLRPNGDPTAQLPKILSFGTYETYFDTLLPFLENARDLTGLKLLRDLLDPKVLKLTFDEFYRHQAPATHLKRMAALNKLYLCCLEEGYIDGDPKDLPITPELRQHIQSYCDDFDVRKPRFGYNPEDAELILETMQERNSPFALAVEVALRAGLRVDEIAMLRGNQVDKAAGVLRIKGKGGLWRDVPLRPELAEKLNPSLQYLFTPSQSWKVALGYAVFKVTQDLGISASGMHRFRSNYAQARYDELIAEGKTDREARKQVSRELGHQRTSVTNSYIPKG